jgi:hypothetical protein
MRFSHDVDIAEHHTCEVRRIRFMRMRVFFSLSKQVAAYRKIGRDLDVFSTRAS